MYFQDMGRYGINMLVQPGDTCHGYDHSMFNVKSLKEVKSTLILIIV